MVLMRILYKIFISKFEGKKQFARPRHKWKENFFMNPKGKILEVVYWINWA